MVFTLKDHTSRKGKPKEKRTEKAEKKKHGKGTDKNRKEKNSADLPDGNGLQIFKDRKHNNLFSADLEKRIQRELNRLILQGFKAIG